MAERWLQERFEQGEALRVHAERTQNQSASAVWERFVRQTARMQAIDEQLRRELPSSYMVMTGERLRYRGQEIYLEHLVIGPTGLFLMEVAEGKDPAWQKDLELNVAFFRESLGTNASFFTCLVIQRTFDDPTLPMGANLVPSVEVALDVIRDRSMGLELTPALGNEMRNLVQAVRMTAPPAPPALTIAQRLSWQELLKLERLPWWTALIGGLVMPYTEMEGGTFFTGLVFHGIIVGIPLIFIRRNPNPRARAKRIKALLAFQAFVIFSLTVGQRT